MKFSFQFNSIFLYFIEQSEEAAVHTLFENMYAALLQVLNRVDTHTPDNAVLSRVMQRESL